ncbi:MAG: TonB-dependent receptor plug domain-containing protein [Flavobacteriaceae bacterium]
MKTEGFRAVAFSPGKVENGLIARQDRGFELSRIWISIFTFFIYTVAIYSQDGRQGKDSILPQDLDEVVVTATRTIRQLSSLPLPVVLVPQKQLQRSGVTRLNEILNEQTGIIMAPDATVGGAEGVQIQGIASDYILVLIDGVPVVGRAGGNLDLSRFAIGNVQQIEVVKGPSSSLFGSEALGGVVNIITEKPSSEKVAWRVSHRAATFSHHNTNLGIAQRQGKWGYSIFADRLGTEGYDLTPDSNTKTVNPHYNYTVNGRLYHDASEKLHAFASARYFFQEFDVAPSTSIEKDANVQLRFDHHPSKKSNFQYEFYYTSYITEEKTIDPTSNEILFGNDFNQKLFRPEIRYNHDFSNDATLSVGGGYNFETLDRELFSGKVSFGSQYLFAQYDVRPIEKLNVIIGARFDNHSEYNSQLSPKISGRFQIAENWAIKGSVGSGFKAPDFRQLYLDFTNALGGGYSVFGKQVEAEGIQRLLESGGIASTSSVQVSISELGAPLNAESSVGYNLGVVHKRGKWSSEINFFRNDFANLIDTRVLATKTNGQNVFGYINRERVYTQGVEVDLKYRFLDNLELSAGYQLVYAYDKDREAELERGQVFVRDPETQQTIELTRDDYVGLENRSRHILNFKAFYEVPKWDSHANLRVVYRSRYGQADTNGNELLDRYDDSFIKGYGLVNLALGKTFYGHYQLQLGVDNLLDFKGNNPIAGDANGPLWVNPGIRLFAKLTIQL